MLSFAAVANSNNILLSWSTASEMNNRIFEIQRADGNDGENNLNWISIGSVEGKRPPLSKQIIPLQIKIQSTEYLITV